MNETYGPACDYIDIENIYTVDDLVKDHYHTYFKIKETNYKGC